MIKETISYAQNREDLILAGFFLPKEDGFYVDVGANEPSRDSVTKLFYDRGWRGINIEPLEQHYQQLEKARPRDTNLRVGVGEKEGELLLREYTSGTGLSTLSSDMKEDYLTGINNAATDYVDHKIKVKTLRQIFNEEHINKISFMKVDVEGFEYEVLSGNDWKVYRPEVICIEANHVRKDWRKILEQNKYKLAFSDGLNEYYIAQESQERSDKFSYVEAVVSKEPIVMYRLLPKIEDYDRTKQTNLELAREDEVKKQYILHLEGFINEVTPLRRHIARQVKTRLRKVHHKIIRRLERAKRYTPKAVTESVDQADLLAAVRNTDVQNFLNYNAYSRAPILLRVYLSICVRLVTLVKVLLGLRRR